MSYDLSILKEGIREYGVTLSDRQEEQFMRYYELLVQWNEVMNLTAITEFDQVLLKHFADSLSIAGTLDMEKIHSCIDVGTGAGFPGIPLKIAFPHLKVTLLDSLNKRLNFLNEVIGELGLEKISTVHLRAEEGGKKPEYREKYDLAVSRAVSRLSVLCEYCMPYVKKGGTLMYSTCTVNDGENRRQIEAFTEKNRNFEIIYQKQFLPTQDVDGFYICKMLKKG